MEGTEVGGGRGGGDGRISGGGKGGLVKKVEEVEEGSGGGERGRMESGRGGEGRNGGGKKWKRGGGVRMDGNEKGGRWRRWEKRMMKWKNFREKEITPLRGYGGLAKT